MSNSKSEEEVLRMHGAANSEIPEKFTPKTDSFDYVRREEMIPMRDGVKLKTIILVPKGFQNTPIIITRTPYNASERTLRFNSPKLTSVVPQMNDTTSAARYIIVYQDVRGKYGSEGDYIMTKPLEGSLNTTGTDHATDTYDTIEWLMKHVPESNGRVAAMGGSYEGYTTLMCTVNPHPALKPVIAFASMVDGWEMTGSTVVPSAKMHHCRTPTNRRQLVKMKQSGGQASTILMKNFY
jgi:putative CocE/NonD family hydrolase